MVSRILKLLPVIIMRRAQNWNGTLCMSNSFRDWDMTKLAAHNKRVAGEPIEQPKVVTHTNLVISKTTDEEKLNKLERDWLRELRLMHPKENIGIQSITLKLANDCRLTPDFWTVDPNGQHIFWETKGYMRGDADVKLRVAARLFLQFRFILVTREKGKWVQTPIKP